VLFRSAPEAEFKAELQTSLRLTLALTLLAVALALALGAFFLVRLSRPLRILSQAVQTIARGDYGQRVSINRRDELGALAAAFNLMTERLQASFAALAEAKGDLETKVAERTQELSEKNLLLEIEMADRRRIIDLLARSEERFRTILEQSPQVIQLFDPDGTCVEVNRAWEENWGGVKEEMINKYNILQDHQLADLGLTPDLERAFRGEAVELPEFEFDPAKSGLSGRARWLSVRAYSIKDAVGAIMTVVVVHEDVTLQRQARAQREGALKLEGVMELAGAAWHELNQPLQVILGQCELLQMELPPDHPAKVRTALMEEEIERLLAIIRRIEKITRYETVAYVGQEPIIDLDKAADVGEEGE
jgi:PAS domain S-box-containing protein